jgi:hypothetical protein
VQNLQLAPGIDGVPPAVACAPPEVNRMTSQRT